MHPVTKRSSAGVGIDFAGNPVIDPTANVIALVKEHERYNDMRFQYVERIADLRAKHQHELRDAEGRTAETLRDLVATTAKALQEQNSAFTGEVTKRLLALELAVSGSTSKGEGGKQMWAWVGGAILLAIAIASFWMRSH
jgi:hypothetical protein